MSSSIIFLDSPLFKPPHFSSPVNFNVPEYVNKQIFPIAKEALKQFDKTWSYVGKALLLTRHVLNATLRSCRWISHVCESHVDQKITTALSRLKLFSLISVPLSLISIPSILQKIGKSFYSSDYEGVALSSLSLSILVTDMFDSTTTFVSGLLQTMSLAPIEWISASGTPVAFVLIALGSISRSIRLVHLSQFLGEMHQELGKKVKSKELSSIKDLQAAFNAFIEKKLGTPQAKDAVKNELKFQVDELKKTVLERHTNSKAASLLSSLSLAIANKETLTEDDASAIGEVLKEIESIIHEEMWVQAGYLLTNAINALALILFFIPIPPVIPFLLLAISLAGRIGLLTYQDWYQSRESLLTAQTKQLLAV